MKFHVLPYTLARCFVPEEPTLAIRIFDPDSTRHDENNSRQKLVESTLWVAELTYTFADFDPQRYSGFSPEYVANLTKEYEDKNSLITLDMAKQIIQDFEKHKDKISAVLIHCNAALSRSPTLALFLCQHFNVTPEWVGTRESYMKKVVKGERAPNVMVWDILVKAGQT